MSDNRALAENPDSGRSMFGSTPFGGDRESKTHVQPAASVNTGGMPGEQQDPRWESRDTASFVNPSIED